MKDQQIKMIPVNACACEYLCLQCVIVCSVSLANWQCAAQLYDKKQKKKNVQNLNNLYAL